MPDVMFPRRVRRQNHSCRLLCVRKIPDRQPLAIYCGPPTLIAGELVHDYLVVGPDFELLDQAHSFELAMAAMFKRQHTLLPKTRRQSLRTSQSAALSKSC